MLNTELDASAVEGISQHGIPPRGRLQANLVGAVVTLPVLLSRLTTARHAGQTIAFTNGCFDLLHVGHVRMLEEAASLADVLVVAVNSDASVRRLKGPARPVVTESDRATMLSALSCVDYVVIFDDARPHSLLDRIRPDVLVKGGTYTIDEVVGREIVESYGGRVCLTGCVEGVSTTRLLATLRQPADTETSLLDL